MIFRRFLVVGLVLASACSSSTPTRKHEASPTPSRAPQLSWTHGAAFPLPRTEVAAAALEGHVYAGGGLLAGGAATDRVDVYDPAADRWSVSVPFPEPLHHTSLVATGGRLYAVGGYRQDGSASAKMWSRAPGDRAWRAEPPLPTARGAFACIVDARGRIHAVGGASRFEPRGRLVDAHEVFDPARRTWTMQAPMPGPRDHLTGASVGNEIFAIGGRVLSYTKNLARVDAFDITTGKWRRAPSLRKARGGIAAVASGGRIYVFGGEGPSGTFPQVEYLDVRLSSWSAAPPLPTARHGLGAAGIADRVYVVGGGPRPGISVSGANDVLLVDGQG